MFITDDKPDGDLIARTFHKNYILLTCFFLVKTITTGYIKILEWTIKETLLGKLISILQFNKMRTSCQSKIITFKINNNKTNYNYSNSGMSSKL